MGEWIIWASRELKWELHYELLILFIWRRIGKQMETHINCSRSCGDEDLMM